MKDSALPTSQNPIRRNSSSNAYPLSFSQERLFFLYQMDPHNPAFNEPKVLRVEGKLDLAVLTKVLESVVGRHEVLRSKFYLQDGVPIQKPSHNYSVDLPVFDLSALAIASSSRELEVRRLITEISQRPFDLSTDLMLRSAVLRLSVTEHILLLVTHHIVSDARSRDILFGEIAALYEAFSHTKPSPFAGLPIQYGDYALWQRETLTNEILQKQLSYWRQQLAGIPTVLKLPTDRPRSAAQTFKGSTEKIVISAALTQNLRNLSRQQSVTLFMTLLTAFQILLSRYTGRDSFLVGVPISGRRRSQLENLVGFLVSSLVLRADLSGNPTFLDLLARVRETALGAYAHPDIPFERLLQEFQSDRELSWHPMFQVMFALRSDFTKPFKLSNVVLTPMEVDIGIAKFDLTLAITEGAEVMNASINYNLDLFDAATIKRMAEEFNTLLQGIVDNPNESVWKLPILPRAEREQLFFGWNRTATDYPRDRCLHDLFEMQALQTPTVTAILHEEKQLSYQELNRRSNQLAHYLRGLGVRPGTLVGIHMHRSLDMVVALLGILKAGAAYVPLDPNYPKERLAFVLRDTQSPLVLCQEQLAKTFPMNDAKVVCLDSEWGIIYREPDKKPDVVLSPDSLAYVIYTSGSTGKPKGVQITHKAVVNFVTAASAAYTLKPNDRILQFSSISFDTAVEEIFPCLTRGCTLVLRTDSMLDSVSLFLEKCHDWGITVLDLPTAYWHELIEGLHSEGPTIPEKLRLVIIGGEQALHAKINRWHEHVGTQVRLLNTYGPTETTVVATLCELTESDRQDTALREVPIGRPIANVETYVLDRHLSPVPIGVPGELHIGGDGLSPGYLNQPKLTAEKFIGHPFNSEPGAHLYKTGDLVRYLPDGNIEFLGRIDDQVKIHGYRIELGEIEAVLAQRCGVRQIAVVAREDHFNDKRLVAYVVLKDDDDTTAQELRKFLQQQLPTYMIPSVFVFLSALPLTPNGKVNRLALPDPEVSKVNSATSFVAPRTPVEKKLARIWAEHLPGHKIGIHDNFFDLGGHSLLALRLMSQIEKTFGKSLSVAALFHSPTVDQLAKLLSQETASLPWSSLVPLQLNGSKPPFFWIHGEISDAFLPRYLGADQPLYGLMHQSGNGEAAQYTTIEDIAAHYLSEIRTVQPKGPYFIGGYCMGGLVALEMAQQLKKQHEEVALLAVLEPSPLRTCRQSPFPPSTHSPFLTMVTQNVVGHMQNLTALEHRKKLPYIWDRVKGSLKWSVMWITGPVNKLLKKAVCNVYLRLGYRLPLSLRSRYILGVYGRAKRHYRLRTYPGTVILFIPKDSSENSQSNWDGLAERGLEIFEVPGNHIDVLEETHVQEWAKMLKTLLERAQTNPSKH